MKTAIKSPGADTLGIFYILPTYSVNNHASEISLYELKLPNNEVIQVFKTIFNQINYIKKITYQISGVRASNLIFKFFINNFGQPPMFFFNDGNSFT